MSENFKNMLSEYSLARVLDTFGGENHEKFLVLHDSIIAYVEQLESALAAEREKTRWVSVGERLPEDNQEVYAREFSGVITHFKYSSKLAEIFRRHYTHWQPPIEPPKEGEE